eukprot:scaffold108809_cov21-Tisochrysis_lutea.AAC.1
MDCVLSDRRADVLDKGVALRETKHSIHRKLNTHHFAKDAEYFAKVLLAHVPREVAHMKHCGLPHRWPTSAPALRRGGGVGIAVRVVPWARRPRRARPHRRRARVTVRGGGGGGGHRAERGAARRRRRVPSSPRVV